MAAYQVRIAYLTPVRRTRHYFHQMVLADSEEAALLAARKQLGKRSRDARIVYETATLRPDSRDAEAAVKGGWKLEDGWWTRPFRPGDDLAAIAAHGFANSRRVNTRTAAGCLAIDRGNQQAGTPLAT